MNNDKGIVDEISHKIKVTSAIIIVRMIDEKPYYEIRYRTLDGIFQDGYGSYELNFVVNWLHNQFEIVDDKRIEILERIKNATPSPGHNLMGCSESFYDPYYAISETFDIKVLEHMEGSELNNLVKLGEAISEALY